MGVFGKKQEAPDVAPPPKADTPPPSSGPGDMPPLLKPDDMQGGPPPPASPSAGPSIPPPTAPQGTGMTPGSQDSMPGPSFPPAPGGPDLSMPTPSGLPPSPTMPPGEHDIASLDIPEMPPMEDLDLPPPPAYPGGPEPAPMGPPSIKEDTFGLPSEQPEEKLAIKPRVHHVPRKEGPSKEQVIASVEKRPEPKGPLYVPVEDYKAVLDGTEHVRNNLKEATDVLGRLNELKNEEDREFEKWRGELEDIQRKLTYVDKIIFESS